MSAQDYSGCGDVECPCRNHGERFQESRERGLEEAAGDAESRRAGAECERCGGRLGGDVDGGAISGLKTEGGLPERLERRCSVCGEWMEPVAELQVGAPSPDELGRRETLGVRWSCPRCQWVAPWSSLTWEVEMRERLEAAMRGCSDAQA